MSVLTVQKLSMKEKKQQQQKKRVDFPAFVMIFLIPFLPQSCCAP